MWRRIEDWSWVLFVLVGVGGASFSVIFFSTGPTNIQVQELTGVSWTRFAQENPEGAQLAELGFGLAGVNGIVAGILGTFIAVGPYRRGERWAWFAMLTFALILVGSQVVNLRVGLGVDLDFPFLMAIMLLGFLLPIRKFFGSRARARMVVE